MAKRKLKKNLEEIEFSIGSGNVYEDFELSNPEEAKTKAELAMLITDIIKAKGFTQFSIKPLQQNGSTFYRVWSSSYATEKEAQVKLEQLSAAGFKGTVKSAS